MTEYEIWKRDIAQGPVSQRRPPFALVALEVGVMVGLAGLLAYWVLHAMKVL